LSSQTEEQYKSIIKSCREIFARKNHDYGTSWRIMRLSSITDQIFIKAQRILTIEKNRSMKVNEGPEQEYMGIINYCVIALIQMKLGSPEETSMDAEQLLLMYDSEVKTTFDLMQDKNQDYGEAWREMRVSTFTDMILMRIMRIRQIEDLEGKTLASEGIDSNFRDIMNYSIFALIRLNENA
jgi:hypothetical protein